MPLNKSFVHRIEIIDECLRNSFKDWTLETLLETVNEKLNERYGKGVKKRTLQNDLKYLIEEKEAPIEKRKKGNNTLFYYSDSNYSLKNLPIDPEEITFLSDAIQILRQVNDFKILNDVDEVINKLQNTLKLNLDGGKSIIQFEKHTTAIGTEYIDTFFSAIKARLPLRVSYQSFTSNTPKSFVFHAYLIKEYRNRWFVIGRKEGSDSISVCALDRIKDVKNSNIMYKENNLFDPDTYFNNLIGVTKPENENIQIIDLKISPNQAPYIKTKPIHHSQEVVKSFKNGSLIVRLHVIANYELRSVLLSFGSDLEVLSPISLRNAMKLILQRASSIYGN